MPGIFKCTRCGKCCHDIPLMPHEFDMFRYILKLEGIWEQQKAVYHPNRNVFKLEGTCPFLENYVISEPSITACRIYTFRPTVCKLYPVSGKCYCVNKKDNTDGETVND